MSRCSPTRSRSSAPERSDAAPRRDRAAGLGGQRRAPDQPRAPGPTATTTRPTRCGSWTPGGRCWSGPSSQPVLGLALLAQVESEFAINDEPGHGTSARTSGRRGTSASTGSSRRTCARRSAARVRGSSTASSAAAARCARCRAALEARCSQAAAESPRQVYPADGVCTAGDQMCSDSIQFRAIGAITPAADRVGQPATFQQADEIQGHGPG